MNKVKPNSLTNKVHKSGSPAFMLMENINFFLTKCIEMGIDPIDILLLFFYSSFTSFMSLPLLLIFYSIYFLIQLVDTFTPMDLFEQKNIPKVIKCLVSVAECAAREGMCTCVRGGRR